MNNHFVCECVQHGPADTAVVLHVLHVLSAYVSETEHMML